MPLSRFLNSSATYAATGAAYDTFAVIVFAIVSLTFFFPVNRVFPLDRRSVAVMGATLCYLSGAVFFPEHHRDLTDSVDFDVLILLTGIMAINFVVVHQRETKDVIEHVQNQIQEDPRKGFWLVSFAAFITSPFLTNDGICLLFVEPILHAFQNAVETGTTIENVIPTAILTLEKGDAFYFLIALACSSNIGSCLTYTGNPQNMIIAEDALAVLPTYMFFLYMLVPGILSWIITILWVERCWIRSRHMNKRLPSVFNSMELTNRHHAVSNPMNSSEHGMMSSSKASVKSDMDDSQRSGEDVEVNLASISGSTDKLRTLDPNVGIYNHMPAREKIPKILLDPQVPVTKKISRIVSSPVPYIVLVLAGMMVALIFVDLISIAGLICIFAVVMVVVTVVGNHWQGKIIWQDADSDPNRELTASEKAINTNEFFEDLFNSIDYSLLLIFLGLFIVVEHLSSTGIPKTIWDGIVGDRPFDTFGSVFRISIFILVASQFLGNVPVIYLAKPNVEDLGDAEKRYAWAVISYVATVGGNLTITGSAANIIVAEKAARIHPSNEINFLNHYKICFWVTLVCCFCGALIITGWVAIESDESW